MKPPQWDSRFYLAKLSDYEIKSRFIVKKQKKPPLQKKISEQRIPAEELHNLWHQLQVPLFHRAYFLEYSSECTREISQLLDRSAPVLRLQTLIKGREKCLRFLREEFEENKFSELLSHLRLLTLNVLEQFQKWRQQLNNVVRWRIDEIDYVDKIRQDTLFLREFYEEHNKKDIFFLWLVKKAYFHEGVHHLYNLVPKEVLKRIREMEVMMIELEYEDQQTNILSRKDDQLVKKYLKEEVEITDTTPRLDLIQILRVNQDQNIENDEDMKQSFPDYVIDEGQEWEILELRKNKKIVGIALCQCENSEEYKKWMIGKMKLNNMDDFPQFLDLITSELEGNEVQIKLIHYLQNEILIDNAQLKQYLKKSGYRWKQQTNENNCRYTIYYKRKEYIITNNLKLRIVLAKSPQPQILQYIHSDDHDFSQYLLEILSIPMKQSRTYLKTTTNQNQIDLLQLHINFPEIQTEVHNQLKYLRLKDITQYQQNYAIEIDKYILFISYLPDQTYNHKQFQSITQDLLLPMFHNHQTRIDTFNYHQHIELNHFIPYQKGSLDQAILIDSPFYFTLFNNTQQLFSIYITDFLSYEQPNENILQIDSSLFILPEFPLQLTPEAFQINIQGTQFVLGIDNDAYTRKWIIYSMSSYDVQLNLQNVTQWIIEQDPYAQEIAINFHHQFIDDAFQINQIVQKQIVSAGFRWKQQNNEHQIRYTKYLKKLNNTLQTQNLLIHIFCQKPQHLNIHPLVHQLSQFETALTQSQLSVRKGVMLPFTKYTSDMLTTEIHQILNASKYDERHFLIHRSQVMQSRCSMGKVYFVQCNAITLCFLQCSDNLQKINEEILQNAEEQCAMSQDLVVPHIDRNYDLLNMGMQFSVREGFAKKVKSDQKLILRVPFYVGIIEPDWLERHNEMICSLIIQ